MPEEVKQVEEVKPTYLDEVKIVKEQMEKTLEENKRILEEIKKIKAEDILSGRVTQPKEVPNVEEDPRDYLMRALKNQL